MCNSIYTAKNQPWTKNKMYERYGTMAVEQGYKKNCVTERTFAQPQENGRHPLTRSKQ